MVTKTLPTRQARRSAAVAALAVLWILGSAPAAPASEFTINACQADRANYSTQAFDDFATRGMVSPRGGVGKTTATFVTGNLLASHLKLRVIAVDANPGFGTLGRLSGHRHQGRSLVHLFDDLDRIATAADLRRYMSVLPTGLHLLASTPDSAPNTERYGELVALLSSFYDAVLLDLGPGITRPLARLAVERADQIVLVTTPDRLTATIVLHALDHLPRHETTVLVNKAHPHPADEVRTVEECFRNRQPHRSVTIPWDRRLATMLDTCTYSLEALDGRTRLPVKRLGSPSRSSSSERTSSVPSSAT